MSNLVAKIVGGLRWRWRTSRIPRPTVASSPVRLIIGPTNSAGQGFRWARAAERLGDVGAYAFSIRPPDDRFRFPADGRVSSLDYSKNYVWRKRQCDDVSQGFTHVLLESGKGLWRGDTAEQITELRMLGINVGLLFHGSDIRTPSVHAQLEPDSPFAGGAHPATEKLERQSIDNHDLARSSGCPIFVSTPQLLDFQPDATWLPVVIDPDPFRAAAHEPPLDRERPVVLHAPSKRSMKGSEAIEPVLRALEAEGLIEYREVTGVPADQMAALYGSADIVLDEFVMGGYGVTACEAMAGGRLVLAHVSDRHRATVRAAAGSDLPVVEAGIADIGDVLRRILSDRETYRELAAQGPDFVHRLHDGRYSAQALAAFLGVEEQVVA